MWSVPAVVVVSVSISSHKLKCKELAVLKLRFDKLPPDLLVFNNGTSCSQLISDSFVYYIRKIPVWI